MLRPRLRGKFGCPSLTSNQGRRAHKPAYRPGQNREREAKPTGYPCNERLPAIKQTPCIRDGQLITLRFQPFSCAKTLCERVQPLFAEV